MPGNVWIVIFKDADLAERIAQKFVTATVAYVPPDASLGEIREALECYADVISLTDLYIRDFPGIKNGKQRAILKPRAAGLPAFIPIRNYKVSLFFAGRVSCCPYCEKTDHLGRDCKRKHERRFFTCGALDHLQRNCMAGQEKRMETDCSNANNKRTTVDKDPTNNTEELAAEGDRGPYASMDMAGFVPLLDDESSDSSTDTLVEVHEENNNSEPTATTITKIAIKTVSKETEELLLDLFASPEKPTQAELDQQAQEQQTPELFTAHDNDSPLVGMEISQNLKRKPKAQVDLRLMFVQSPKSKRFPKHKRRKDKP